MQWAVFFHKHADDLCHFNPHAGRFSLFSNKHNIIGTIQDSINRPESARKNESQFAGFGVAPEGRALKPLPAQLQLDQPSAPSPDIPPEGMSDSVSPAGRKQVASIHSCSLGHWTSDPLFACL